ncbi:GNAT family N-acetyltransferase [Glycomyces buryatensis]|uniref:GNAT family N-acetyltransferase n=1 Tax=Glycomyces buryatensis TaxID=2570927 RepID=A0A4S8PT84_9ACTN|nr:GNAT family N-acetyltransferase [Glycomyces buryatensis]THV33531.1 GNAT family N-acetyltransferase [Glycomyces buryatensis]
MPELISPTARLAPSFSEAVDEFIAEGRGSEDDHSLTGQMIRDYVIPARGGEWVGEWVERYLADEARWQTEPPENFVTMTMLWWVDGDEYLGRISLRHYLNEHLLQIGGHIGYDIRPTARRRGHATAMLAAALPRIAAYGVEKALITCDADNVGSRKAIERNGGVLEDQRGDKLRFWVPTV